MTAPTYVASTTQGAQSTTINVTAPSGVASGDHNLIWLGVPSSTITVTSVPSGWTLERTQTNTNDSTPFTLRCYKSSTSTSTAAFTVSSSTTLTAVRSAYRGGAGVESSVGTNDASSTSNHALASATTTVADSLVVAAGYEDSSGTSKTHTMSGWNERADYSTSGLTRVGMIASYDIVKATAGTQGGTIVSTASDFMSTISVVLAGITTSAPTVGAGADVPGHVVSTEFTRTATENDNGSAITSRAWTIQAGPTGVGSTIGTAAALSWTPTVLGTYTLQYAATNAIGTGTDQMSISVVKQSARFDADGEDYTRTLSPALGTTFTVLGWFRLAVDRDAWTTFFGLDNAAAVGSRYALQCNASGNNLRSVAESSDQAITGGSALAVGTWYAMAHVRTSATAATIYLGTDPASLTTTGHTIPSGQSSYSTFRIGESGWGGEWLNGNAAAVKIYTAALSAAEVEDELAQYIPLRTTDLYAAYLFEDGPSTTDSSGNGRTLSGGSGTTAEAGPVIILGLAAPTVNAGADVTGHYVDTEFTRTATENANGATITSRAWTIQAGPTGVGSTIGTAAALAWTPTVTGTYTLQYAATNSVGTGSDQMSIEVIAPTAPTVGAGADVGSHAINTEFTRTATESANGSAITSRAWTIQAGPAGVGSTIGTAAALAWTPTVAGTYTLQYAATNAIGTGTDQMSITVTSGPPPTVDAGADVAGWSVETLFSRTASATGSGITSREWKIQDGPIDVGQTLSDANLLEWAPQLAGTYVLRFTATNAGGPAFDDMSIEVVTVPATPGQILNIGVGGGKNHFSVDIARTPSERELMECEQIEAGLDEPPFFTGVDDYTRCGFWTQVDAATTSGSSYPRCELREVNPGGSVNAAWDPHDGGTHWIRGRSAATHLMAVKPTLILGQQHSGDDDVIQIRTQLRTGVINLEVVLNGVTASPITLASPYTVDTEYDWMLEILPPINGQTAKGRIYYQSWFVPVHTWLVTDMPATVPGHYYKAGNYLNSNTSTENGNDDEFGSSTLRNLQHWHTGWAAPDNGFWGLPEVDSGADVSSPSGWTITRTGVDGALEAERVWYVVDGPTSGTNVGQYISDSATLSWAPTVQGTYRLRYGVTTDVGTNYDDMLVTVTAPVTAGGGFLPFFNA